MSAAINGKEIRGLLVDLDGVLYVGDKPVPGTVELVERLASEGWARCFLTNTTTKSTASLCERLQKMGFSISERELLSAPAAARDYLENRGSPVCKFLLNEEVLVDFSEFEQSDTKAEAVVIGDIGNAWTYDLLNTVFRLVMDGAELIALHRNKFWQTEEGLQMDIGAFVAGIEYATGREATIMGKPSPDFFTAALLRVGLSGPEVAMIGDDVDTDVGAAQEMEMTGVLVRTGKYREEYVRNSGVKPDLIIDSFADLKDFLG